MVGANPCPPLAEPVPQSGRQGVVKAPKKISFANEVFVFYYYDYKIFNLLFYLYFQTKSIHEINSSPIPF